MSLYDEKEQLEAPYHVKNIDIFHHLCREKFLSEEGKKEMMQKLVHSHLESNLRKFPSSSHIETKEDVARNFFWKQLNQDWEFVQNLEF